VFDDTEWVLGIIAKLENQLATKEEKRKVIAAAREIEEKLPAATDKKAAGYREYMHRLFALSVDRMSYREPVPAIDDGLPDTLARSDTEVGREFGLKNPASIRLKQEELADGREKRVARFVRHVVHGHWSVREAKIFIAAKDEFAEACREAGVKVA